MSDGAQTVAILDVEVELDKATGQLVGFKERAKSEMAGAADGIERELGRAERAAVQTTQRTAAAGASLKETFRGAQPAISGATQALMLMGAQGSPAISGITHALTGMLTNGFTPWGIAIGLATGALGLLVGGMRETAKASEALTAKHEAEATALAKIVTLQERLSAARSAGIAKQAGVAGNVATEMENVERLEGEIASLSNRGLGIVEFQRLAAAREELQVARERLHTEQGIAALRGDPFMQYDQSPGNGDLVDPNARGAGSSKLTSGELVRRQAAAAAAFARGRRFSQVGPVDPAAEALQKQAAAEALTVQRMRDEAAANSLGITQREVELYRLIGEEREKIANTSGQELELRRPLLASYEEELRLLQAQRDAAFSKNVEAEKLQEDEKKRQEKSKAEAAIAKSLAAESETTRGFGVAAAHSITQALNQSIVSGDFDGFFASFQASLTEAVVASFTYALVQRPLESVLGGLTQNIGAFAGAGQSTTDAGAGADAAATADAGAVATKSMRVSPKTIYIGVADGAEVHIGQADGRGVPRGRGARTSR